MTTVTRAVTLAALLAAGCARVPPEPDPIPAPPPERPRHSFRVTCYQGKVGSGVSGSGAVYQTKQLYSATGTYKSGPTNGPQAEVGFRFLRHDGDRDVLEFTYRFPGEPDQRKELAYRDDTLTLFETPTHTVTLEPAQPPDG
jgi:hypothetical protein